MCFYIDKMCYIELYNFYYDCATGGGVDYTSGPYTATFTAGQTIVPFDVPIIDDAILEINETFTVTINSSTLPNSVIVNNPSGATTITIVNDDGM